MKEIEDLFLDLRPHANRFRLIRIGEDRDGGNLVPEDLSSIEGAEWQWLMCTPSKILERFRIIIIEFYGLDNLINHNKFHNL